MCNLTKYKLKDRDSAGINLQPCMMSEIKTKMLCFKHNYKVNLVFSIDISALFD